MSGQRLSIGLRGADANAILELAVAAEREAVDGLWIGDLGGAGDDPGDSFRTMVAAAVAAQTRSVRIGCVLTLREAVSTLRLAEDLAMIDQGAAGRLELLLVLDDADCERRAARMLSAWRGWETADGRHFPVTPRPAQPAIPRLVVGRSFDDPAADHLAAGVLARSEELPDTARPRTRVDRRVVAFHTVSARALIAGGAASAVARIRDEADRWETDEVAFWLNVAETNAIAEEVRVLSRVVAPGIAGGDAQWEMLAELGARAAGLGSAV